MKNTKDLTVQTGSRDPLGWVSGTVGDYQFEAKVHDEGSVYGINEGRVSKLHIYPKADGMWAAIASYDRGWDRKPKSAPHRALLETVLAVLENYPVEIPEQGECE